MDHNRKSELSPTCRKCSRPTHDPRTQAGQLVTITIFREGSSRSLTPPLKLRRRNCDCANYNSSNLNSPGFPAMIGAEQWTYSSASSTQPAFTGFSCR